MQWIGLLLFYTIGITSAVIALFLFLNRYIWLM